MVKAISIIRPVDMPEVVNKDIFHQKFKVKSFSLQKIANRAIPCIFAKKERSKIPQKRCVLSAGKVIEYGDLGGTEE